MTNFTLGFIFDESLDRVLLIKKEKPIIHKDLWNGLGGKLESDETIEECMDREFKEESGALYSPQKWIPVSIIKGNNYSISVFTGIISPREDQRQWVGNPWVRWFSINEINSSSLLVPDVLIFTYLSLQFIYLYQNDYEMPVTIVERYSPLDIKDYT